MNKIIEKFDTYKRDIEGISESSINQYNKELDLFFNYLGIKDDESICAVSQNNIKSWLEYKSTNGNKPRSRNKSLAIIKTFYRYLYEQEDIQIDMKILLLKKSKVPYKEKLWLEVGNETDDEGEDTYVDEISSFLDNIKDERTQAMVALLATTGARYSEIIGLTLADYERKETIIKGKGNKERTLFFSNELLRSYVDKYIKTKRKNIIKRTKVKTDLLFVSNKGTKVGKQNFIKTLKRYARLSGMERWKEMSPHVLRHSFISNSLNSGVSIGTVKEAVGHSNIAVTNNYTHTTKNRIHELMNNSFQRKGEQ